MRFNSDNAMWKDMPCKETPPMFISMEAIRKSMKDNESR